MVNNGQNFVNVVFERPLMYVIVKDGMSGPQKKSIAGISRNLLKVQLELTLVNSNID